FVCAVFLFADDALAHFEPEVVAFAGALTHAAEHGVAAVHAGDVVDQLHDHDGLAHAGAAEQTDFAALGVGLKQVDDLDAGFENLGLGAEHFVGGRLLVDGAAFFGGHRRAAVHGVAEQVEDAAQALVAHGHGNRRAGVLDGLAADDAVGGVHGHGADLVAAQVLLNLESEIDVLGRVLDLEGRIDLRHLHFRELYVDDRSDDLYDFTRLGHVCSSALVFAVKGTGTFFAVAPKPLGGAASTAENGPDPTPPGSALLTM